MSASRSRVRPQHGPEAELRLLFDASLVLASADDLLPALRAVLRLVCRTTGWDMGQAWLPAAEGSRLECAPVWHGRAKRLREFRQASERTRFLPGAGLPGRAWSAGEPRWSPDARREGRSARGPAAAGAGLRAGVAVPVRVDDETVAVLEFHAIGSRRREEWLVRAIAAVGAQVAAFIRRGRAEGALRESEERFRSMVEHAGDAVVVADARDRILLWNRSARTIFGYGAREVLGKPFATILPERYRAARVAEMHRFLDSGEVWMPDRREEMHGRRKDGSEFPLEVSAYSWEARGRTFFGAFLRDITRRRAAEDGLRASETRFRSLVESAVFGIYESNLKGRLVLVNRALVDMLGYPSAKDLLRVDVGRDLFVDPAERERKLARYRDGDVVENLDLDWKRRDGRRIRVRLNGRPVRNDGGRLTGFRMIVEDVTERRALEARLLETHKLEALGRMAGSVAHDFNNVITAVLGYCDLLLDRYRVKGDRAEAVRQIRKAGETAASLAAQLLAFGRRKSYEPRPVEVDGVVVEMREVLARLVGREVEFEVRTGAEAARVESDPTRIQQVLLNLVVNARDAVGSKGKITVETGRWEPPATGAPAIPGLAAVPMYRLSVTDTGQGMSEEIKSRLFEPFFTTKEAGKGTGLGLATVHGIVKQGGGDIRVVSAPGQGARFDVFFPLLAASDATARPGRTRR